MTEISNEIKTEVNKIYKSHFKYTIEKFPQKLNVVSRLDVEIPGLAT